MSFVMRVYYHIKLKSSDRNDNAGIHIVYALPDDIGTIERIFSHRGIDPRPVYSRECSQEEWESEYVPFWRMRPIYYRDFDLLIEDEKRATDDPEHFRKLEEIRKKYAWLFTK